MAHVGTAPRHSLKKSQHSLVAKVWPTVLLSFLAICILLYPVVVSQLNNWAQINAAVEYTETIESTPDEGLVAHLDKARLYNETRAEGPILDPWLARITEDNLDYQEYLQHLDLQEVMAQLVVPAAEVNLPVYHGTSETVLQKGVGHLYGSDLPVGGSGNHSVLTAHTGLTNATLFDRLIDVTPGDEMYVSVSGEKLKYVVTEINVVLPNETDLLKSELGKDKLTLITCTPYGINTHRLLVTGERVPFEDEEKIAVFRKPPLSWTWWMLVFIGISAAIAVLTLWWVLSTKRRLEKVQADSSLEA